MMPNWRFRGQISLKDNGDPPFLLHFPIEGVKISNIGKYE